MKKILCAVLALAAMTSCSKEYTVDYNKQAIAFGEAFVDNGTRADYSSGKTVTKFNVWGTVKGEFTGAQSVYIFNGDEVKNTGVVDGVNTTAEYGEVWFCDNIQYWVPNTNYAFTAVVDGVLSADHSKIEHTVADGNANLDLLLATATASVDEYGAVTGTYIGTNGLVKFNFNHLLSKLQFNQPTHNMAGYTVVVTGIEVANVLDKGVYTINGGTWAKAADAEADVELTFSPVTGGFETRQILPLEQTLTVTVYYDVMIGSDKISEVVKTGTIPAQTYAQGYVYAITPQISATEIQFTVEKVNGWTGYDADADGDVDADDDITPSVN